MKIQELEARLTDSESENVNLNFQVRELKAFLEEKTNLLELYNPKSKYTTSFHSETIILLRFFTYIVNISFQMLSQINYY